MFRIDVLTLGVFAGITESSLFNHEMTHEENLL
jgi:hypothetical protein